MQKVSVEIPSELILAAGLDTTNLSAETARLLALELYRDGDVAFDQVEALSELRVRWTGGHREPAAEQAGDDEKNPDEEYG